VLRVCRANKHEEFGYLPYQLVGRGRELCGKFIVRISAENLNLFD
jgi:hypothetical protein